MKKKSFGQHFLHDKKIIKKIASALGEVGDARVIEIGPGEGALTEQLVKDYKLLTLIEADRDLIEGLEERFPKIPIVLADAAKVDYAEIVLNKPWVLIGNLPYNAAAAIIVHALGAKNPPKKMIIMVQKEHADRIRAVPGEMGLLSVVVQATTKVKKVFDVARGAFSPPPRVDSTVLEITLLDSMPSSRAREGVIALAKSGFRARRKQLQKNLALAGLASSSEVKKALKNLHISPNARAQELSMENWFDLFEILG